MFVSILFMPWMFLGMSMVRDELSSADDISGMLGMHALFASLLALAVWRARSSEKKQLFGLTAFVWIAASLGAYVVGLLSPLFISV
jgi:heme A synthase